jgi:hypothetical protein
LRRRALRSLLLAVLAMPACGGAGSSPETLAPPLSSLQVPPTIAGLAVTSDASATKKLLSTSRGSNSFATDGVVYALRRKKELMAVLEVLRLTPDARPEDREFRRSIVGQIGGRVERPQRVGERLVYQTKGNQQFIYVWFFDRLMAVLIVRDDKAIAGKIDPKALVADAVRISA